MHTPRTPNVPSSAPRRRSSGRRPNSARSSAPRRNGRPSSLLLAWPMLALLGLLSTSPAYAGDGSAGPRECTTLTTITELRFGSLTAFAAGTLTVDPTGARTATGTGA